MVKRLTIFPVILLLASLVLANSEYVHHDLKVTLDPDRQFLRVTDTIHLPEPLVKQEIHFLLHGGMTIGSPGAGLQIKKEEGELKSEFFGINTAQFEIKKEIPLNHYALLRENPGPASMGYTFTLQYEGRIHHPLKQLGAEYDRGFSETPGIICADGVYLGGSTFWVPWFNDNLVTFKLETQIAEPWDVVSAGKRVRHEIANGIRTTTWDSPQPLEEIHLVAAPFQEYGLQVGQVEVMAFLRSADPSLANQYLETTGQYLEMYDQLIGPYPFSKFALIENFWETGYGMSSFTLLGPKIIRFPFILHSSYPHELLHNWWGNSVYVDYEAGNWCEGLTVYLADHLIKEQRDQGSEYRKTTLQGYTHYAAGKKEEFPLTQFKARYDSLSSSIGYGKSMMLFHMLRQQIGDSLFKRFLQHFYNENKYKKATFSDIRKSVEAVTGKDFNDFFQQWVTRSGVPELRISHTSVENTGKNHLLHVSLEQVQPGDSYALNIPVAVSLAGKKEAIIHHLEMTEKHRDFELSFDQQPLCIDVDPRFDVMRKLHPNEIPPTLSNAFGAENVLILLPTGAAAEFLKGYRELAEKWAGESEGKIEVKPDNQVTSLPSDRAVWILGWENLHRDLLQKGIAFYQGEMDDTSVTLDKKKLFPDRHSIVVAIKNEKNPGQVVILLSTDRVAALPGLGRKLPHYGKYSFLGFEGDEPVNMHKGQWPTVGSPLSVCLEPSSPAAGVSASLPPEQPLARLAPLFSPERMLKHIRYLASEELEGRGLGSKGLEKAAHYIALAFKDAGLKPGGDAHSYYQTWETAALVKKSKQTVTLHNVIGIIPGSNPQMAGQAVILCAHYDHLGLGWPDVHQGDEGKIHFGADDNASGVAVMLELAHTLGNHFKPERSLVFIAFTGEESGLLGSGYYVKNLKQSSLKNLMAVVNLDTVGRLTETGKLMVIGGASAREWRFIFMGIGYTTGVQTELLSQDLDASDQVTFIKAGIPGIQLFSGPHQDYHRPGDTPDKIEARGLPRVAAVAREAVVYLCGRKEPLTFTSSAAAPAGTSPGHSQGTRKVSTGIMPDFSFSGQGVKIALVSPGSPAEKAGLKKDDVIIQLGNRIVDNLTAYSDALKTHKPGDTTTMAYRREGKEYSTQITLAAR
jgi:aminopeptidase N